MSLQLLLLDHSVANGFSRIKLRFRTVSSASAAADLLLFERPKRSRQEKGRPELRARDGAAGSRRSGGVLRQYIHVLTENSRASMRAPPVGAIHPTAAAALRDPGSRATARAEQGKAKRRARAKRLCPSPVHGGRCRRQMGANGAKVLADQKICGPRAIAEVDSGESVPDAANDAGGDGRTFPHRMASRRRSRQTRPHSPADPQ